METQIFSILDIQAHLLHSLQTGSTEKALKYTDKAVNHFKKLKGLASSYIITLDYRKNFR